MRVRSVRDQPLYGARPWRFILLSVGLIAGGLTLGATAASAHSMIPAPPAPTAATTLASELIIGRWTGSVTVPSGWQPIDDFWVEFRSDGSYSAGSTGAPAFYYGTNDDYPEKVYSVIGPQPDGQPGWGTIAIVWAADGAVHTVGTSHLVNIVFSDTGDRLEFDFWKDCVGGYGPIHYDLVRSDPTTSTTTTTTPSTTVAPSTVPPAPTAVSTLASELIIGRWTGSVTVPSGWQPIDDFWVEFRSDGSYSAGSTGAPAFYYGTNDDYPEKVYSVIGHPLWAEPDWGTMGTVAIVWAADGAVYTVGKDHLVNIVFSDTGDRLEFDFWHRCVGEYGPIHYDLVRSDPTTSTTTTTTTAASTTVAPSIAPPTNVASTLPWTGSKSADMQLFVAIGLLALGSIAVATARSR